MEWKRERDRLRWHSLALLAVVVLYQALLALSAAPKAEALRRMVEAFGGTPPLVSSTLIAAVPYWPGVPAFFFVVWLLLWRRPRISAAVSTVVLVAAALAAAAMNFWLIEGMFAPAMSLGANVQ